VTTLRTYVPGEPLALDEVVERLPAVRQSLLSAFDDCALSAYFTMAHGQLWSTHPQARGTIMHRAIAECLRTMQAQQEDTIPVSEALEILHEVLWQRDIPDEELVRVPVRQVSELRRFISKFAADNSFDVKAIVDIEKRLAGKITYVLPETGEVVERVLTGQLDLLMYKPPQGALVVDWKDTWGLPPDHSEQDAKGEEDDGSGLSWHGYFQQRFYAWLVFVNYPKVQSVTLREFYIRKTEPRPATVHRSRLHLIEQELAFLIAAFDAAVAQGKPPWPYRLEDTLMSDGSVQRGVGKWRPTPGKHCGFCLRPGQCPIEDEARREGAISSQAMADRYAAEFMVASEVRQRRMDALKVWVDAHGPVIVKWAKARMTVRWRDNSTGSGRRFGVFPAAESDRSSKQERAVDRKLVEAAKASAERARQARSKRSR
jgi:DNA-directed RNA polymerase subunit F